MQLEIYSIFDMKAKAYLQPFFMHNGEMAQREFTNVINDPSTRFGRNPEDYQLFHLGSFFDDQGEITPVSPMIICSGASCVLPANVTALPLPNGEDHAT